MSTVEQAKAGNLDINEDVIADYLLEHPDFFSRYSSLLNSIEIPHAPGGTAISLVERQVSVLRQRNDTLDKKLHDLVQVARGNDELANKIHVLTIKLLGAKNRDEVIRILEEQLRTDFNADQAVLVLFVAADENTENSGNFLRQTERDAPAIGSFKTFLQAGVARCGTIRDAQRDYLFGSDNVEIGSVALIPLGADAATGFLAIGSRSADHFHPGKSIDFLTRLGELFSSALESK
jgi:uncharacterized protein YigA (DUF484 family)